MLCVTAVVRHATFALHLHVRLTSSSEQVPSIVRVRWVDQSMSDFEQDRCASTTATCHWQGIKTLCHDAVKCAGVVGIGHVDATAGWLIIEGSKLYLVTELTNNIISWAQAIEGEYWFTEKYAHSAGLRAVY